MQTSFVILSLLSLLAVAFATTYSSCGTGSLTLTALILSPDPPKAGANLTVQVKGSLGEYLFHFPFLQRNFLIFIHLFLASALTGGNVWMNVSLQYQGWHPVPGSPFQFGVSETLVIFFAFQEHCEIKFPNFSNRLR
jgi:hypothetical protein